MYKELSEGAMVESIDAQPRASSSIVVFTCLDAPQTNKFVSEARTAICRQPVAQSTSGFLRFFKPIVLELLATGGRRVFMEW
jgi:hypothetical protein